ncbi:hypothetical protein pb186bvf_013567 [Paramecium bursaria]
MLQELEKCLKFYMIQPLELSPYLTSTTKITCSENFQDYNDSPLEKIEFQHLDQYKIYQLEDETATDSDYKYQTQQSMFAYDESLNIKDQQITNLFSYQNKVDLLWQQSSLKSQIQEKIAQHKLEKQKIEQQQIFKSESRPEYDRLPSKSPQSRQFDTQTTNKTPRTSMNNLKEMATLHKKKFSSHLVGKSQEQDSNPQGNIQKENKQQLDKATFQIKLDIKKFLDQQNGVDNQKQKIIQKNSICNTARSKSPQDRKQLSKSPIRNSKPQISYKQMNGITHININLYKK